MIRLILLISFLAPSAVSQKFIHWWDKSYEAAFTEARIRNVPVLIAFIQDDEEANDRIVAGLYEDSSFIKMTGRCVPMVACITEHETKKQTVRGNVRSCCTRFGASTCSRHRHIDSYARPRYWKDDVKTPSHIVVYPDGKEAGRIIDVAGTDTYVALVKKAQSKLGRGMTANLFDQVLEDLNAVDQALSKKDFEVGIKRLVSLEKICRKHPLETRIRGLWNQVNGEGAMILARAQDLQKQKSFLGALRLLSENSRRFKGARVYGALKAAEGKVRRTKEGRAAERLLKREARALPEFTKARKAEQGGDFVKAASCYEKVIKKAQETPLAQQAKARLDALKKDPDIGVLISNAAQSKLAMKEYKSASSLFKRGDKEAGKKALQRIVEKYPGTRAAKKAKQDLEKSG